jgi:hypothetical protein
VLINFSIAPKSHAAVVNEGMPSSGLMLRTKPEESSKNRFFSMEKRTPKEPQEVCGFHNERRQS